MKIKRAVFYSALLIALIPGLSDSSERTEKGMEASSPDAVETAENEINPKKAGEEDKAHQEQHKLREEARDYFRRGVSFFQEKNYEEARISFENVIRLTPDNSRAHLYLGSVCAAMGLAGEASEHYRAYLSFDTESKQAQAVRKILEEYDSYLESQKNGTSVTEEAGVTGKADEITETDEPAAIGKPEETTVTDESAVITTPADPEGKEKAPDPPVADDSVLTVAKPEKETEETAAVISEEFKQLNSQLRAKSRELHFCLRDYHIKTKYTGNVEYTLIIDADGHVSRFFIDKPSDKSFLEECFKEVMKDWRFSRIDDKKTVIHHSFSIGTNDAPQPIADPDKIRERPVFLKVSRILLSEENPVMARHLIIENLDNEAYSKMKDEMLFLVAYSYFVEENYREAVKILVMIHKQFPDSSFLPYSLLMMHASFSKLEVYDLASEIIDIMIRNFPDHLDDPANFEPDLSRILSYP